MNPQDKKPQDVRQSFRDRVASTRGKSSSPTPRYQRDHQAESDQHQSTSSFDFDNYMKDLRERQGLTIRSKSDSDESTKKDTPSKSPHKRRLSWQRTSINELLAETVKESKEHLQLDPSLMPDIKVEIPITEIRLRGQTTLSISQPQLQKALTIAQSEPETQDSRKKGAIRKNSIVPPETRKPTDWILAHTEEKQVEAPQPEGSPTTLQTMRKLKEQLVEFKEQTVPLEINIMLKDLELQINEEESDIPLKATHLLHFRPMELFGIYFSQSQLAYDLIPEDVDISVTPFYLMAYYQVVFLGYMLITHMLSRKRNNDDMIKSLLSNEVYDVFINFIPNLNVPMFIKELIVREAKEQREHRGATKYIPPISKFKLTRDYTELMPVNVFLHAHDLLLKYKGNNPHSLFVDLLRQVLIKNNNVPILYVSDLIYAELKEGQNQSITDEQFCVILKMSKKHQKDESTQLDQRKVEPINRHFSNDINPYEYLFGINRENLLKVFKLCIEINEIMKTIEPESESFATMFRNYKNRNLDLTQYIREKINESQNLGQ